MMDMNIKNFIGNEFVEVKSGEYFDTFNPSTGKVLTKIPDSGEEDIELAVQAATKAFPIWSSMTKEMRSNLMNKVADMIESRLEEFAIAESTDQGKPVSLARMVCDFVKLFYFFVDILILIFFLFCF